MPTGLVAPAPGAPATQRRRHSLLVCPFVSFRVVGHLRDVSTIATGRGIRELQRLRKLYGRGRWRKRKGVARIVLASGTERDAELHWYEAHGIGLVEVKIKRLL